MIPVHDFFVEKYGVFLCHVAPEALPTKLAENLEPDQLYAILQFDLTGGVYRLTCAAFEEWELDDHFQVQLSQVTPINSQPNENLIVEMDEIDEMDEFDIDMSDYEDLRPSVPVVPVHEMPTNDELERMVYMSVDHELRWERDSTPYYHSELEYFG